MNLGFRQCNSDYTPSLFKTEEEEIVVMGDDQTGIHQLKRYLGKIFEIKDLGDLKSRTLQKYFLGIEVSRSSKGVCLLQSML